MKFSNEVRLSTTSERAWTLLDDPELLARAMPGATLTSAEGNLLRGQVAVRIGPLGLTYQGRAETVARNEETKTLFLRVAADEQRGAGTANADVSIRLVPDGNATRVMVETDLDLTGRPAQLGAGIIENVAGGIFEKFAQNLSLESDEHPEEGASIGDEPAELVLVDTKSIIVGVSVVAALVYLLRRFVGS